MIFRRIVIRRRRGMSVIEVVVVICLIVLLGSLFMPATRRVHRSARKLECMNAIRQVGLAFQNAASSTGGEIVPLTYTIESSRDDSQLSVGWPVMLLPMLDQAAVYRSIKSNAVTRGRATVIAESDLIYLKVFACSDAETVSTGGINHTVHAKGSLNYVINTGFISSEVWGTLESTNVYHQPYLINWTGATEPPYRSTNGLGELPSAVKDIAQATGVCWRVIGSPKTQQLPNFDTIEDGLGNTLLFAENLNAGPWNSTDVNSLGFGICIPVDPKTGSPSFGPGGEFEGPSSLNVAFTGSTFTTSSKASWINQRSDTLTVPRPSSRHVGGVNVVMCDGSARFLNEHMSYLVYIRLMTSNGVKYGEEELNSAKY